MLGIVDFDASASSILELQAYAAMPYHFLNGVFNREKLVFSEV